MEKTESLAVEQERSTGSGEGIEVRRQDPEESERESKGAESRETMVEKSQEESERERKSTTCERAQEEDGVCMEEKREKEETESIRAEECMEVSGTACGGEKKIASPKKPIATTSPSTASNRKIHPFFGNLAFSAIFTVFQ